MCRKGYGRCLLGWGLGTGAAALRRSDLDLDHCVVRVVRSTAQMNDGKLIVPEPKSRAGSRTVAFPREIADELRWHLERFAEPDGDGLVFVGPLGGRLRRSNFRDIWLAALSDAGLSGLHLHDLRHTGDTMAAATGASLRELMERMGHSSSRAALIYQHASRDRDDSIAAALGDSRGCQAAGQLSSIGHAAGTQLL